MTTHCHSLGIVMTTFTKNRMSLDVECVLLYVCVYVCVCVSNNGETVFVYCIYFILLPYVTVLYLKLIIHFTCACIILRYLKSSIHNIYIYIYISDISLSTFPFVACRNNESDTYQKTHQLTIRTKIHFCLYRASRNDVFVLIFFPLQKRVASRARH